MRWSAFLLASLAIAVHAEERVSRIYEIGNLTKPLFTQKTKIERSQPDSFVSDARIEDATGKTVMTEKVIVENGGLKYQAVDQLQSNEAWELKVEGGEVIFNSFRLVDGKKVPAGTGSHEDRGDFINGPLTEPFIAKNWDSLLRGEVLKIRFSVLELEKTVGFSFQKESVGQRNGKPVVAVKMKPSNFFISMLVDPIHLEFDPETKRLVYFKGRTPLKKTVGGKLSPLDAEILYE